MRYILVICVIFLKIPLIYASGGHNVGNGGDIAELQMIEIWAHLDKSLKFCLLKDSSCDLNAKEFQAITQVVKHFSLKGEIKFSADLSDWAFRIREAEVIFNQNALYNQKISKPYSSLQGLVLWSLLVKNKYENIWSQSLANKVVKYLFSTSQRKSVTRYGKNYSLVWVHILESHDLVFFDQPYKAFDITQLFLSKNLCPTSLVKFDIDGIRYLEVSQNQVTVFGKVNFYCKGVNLTSDFKLYLPFDMSSDRVEELVIHYFYITEQ